LFVFLNSIEKKDDCNYFAWALEIGLWLNGLGYKTHLTTSAKFIPIENKTMDKDWCPTL